MPEIDYRWDSQDAARNLLAHMREDSAYTFSEARGRRVLRWEPGTFVSKLIDLLLVSDAENRALLSVSFPAYAWAVQQYKDEPEGLATLAQAAGWTEET